MVYTDEDRAADIATQLALIELVRIAIAEISFTPDRAEFRRRIEAIERTAVDGLTNRRIFPQANDATENLIKEQASTTVTKILTSIRHRDDPTPYGA